MIYTIGHTENYERAFKEEEHVEKLGRGEIWNGYYQGGSVFKTFDEANAYIRQNNLPYSVYGVLADWDKDTAISDTENAPYRDLLKTSPLVRLDD